MAKPRVFISSTYYDLKHIRSSLDVFLASLGYDSILSEKGDIAYSPDQPLDESCYREARTADIFVLIVGGRYGSAASSESGSEAAEGFYDRYESITKQEFKSALQEDVPVYILVEAGVYNEYQTYRKNRDNRSIEYAHVDSINIFEILDEILRQKQNNPVKQFEKYADIENWLRDQWSGLFRELLNRKSNQAQLASLAGQVAEMSEVNKTLRRYIEMIVSQLAPEKSEELIESENQRLKAAREQVAIHKLHVLEYLRMRAGIPEDESLNIIRKVKTTDQLVKELINVSPESEGDFIKEVFSGQHRHPAFDEMNQIREILELPRLETKRKTNKTEQGNR